MKPCPKRIAVLLSLIGLNLSWSTAAHSEEAGPAATGPNGSDDVARTPADPDTVAQTETARVVAYSGSVIGAQQRARIAHLRANLGLASAVEPKKVVRKGQRFVRVATRDGGRRAVQAAARAKPLVAIQPIPQPEIQVRHIAAEHRPIQPATPAQLTAEYLDPLMPFLRTLASAETRQQPGAFTGEFDLPIAGERPQVPSDTRLASLDDVYDPIDYGHLPVPVAAASMASKSAASPAVVDGARVQVADAALDAGAGSGAAPVVSPIAPIAVADAGLRIEKLPIERPLADWPWLQSPDGRAAAAFVDFEPVASAPIRVAPQHALSAGFDIFDRDLAAPRVAKPAKNDHVASKKLAPMPREEREWIDIFDPRLAAAETDDGRRTSRFEPIIATPAAGSDLIWYDIFEPLMPLVAEARLPAIATLASMPVIAGDQTSFDIFDATLIAKPTTFDSERLAQLDAAVATGRSMLATRDDALSDFHPPVVQRQLEPNVQIRVEPAYNAISDAMARVALAAAPARAMPVEIPLATDDAWDEIRMGVRRDASGSGADDGRFASGFDDEPRTLLEGTLVAVAEGKLDEMRGGFEGDGGLKISFGIERAVYINGALVTTTSLNVADLSKLTGGQALGTVLSGGSMGLIQNGPGNTTFQMGQVAASTVGTVIQNTLNNQNIQGVTMINATVNSLDLVKSNGIQSSIRNALTDSIRR